MDEVVGPLRVHLLHRTGHLRPPVTAVLVRVASLVVLVDPAEVSAIVLSIVGQLADFKVRVGNKPFHRLRVEDNRGGVLRTLVGGVDDILVLAVDRSASRDIRGDLDKATRAIVVETFRERTAVEHIAAVALLGQQRGAVGTEKIVNAITPADVFTNIVVELDQVFNRGAFGKHVEDGRTVIGNRITVITSVVLIQAIIDLAQDTKGHNTRRSSRTSDGGEVTRDGGGATVIKARFHTEKRSRSAGSEEVIVVITLSPLDVDVVGKDLDVVVDIVNRECRGANVFQADPIRLNRLMAEVELVLVKGIANRLDRSQAGIGFARDASDAHIFPSATNGKGALGDGVFDDCSHVIGESRLGNEAEIGIFVQTEAIGAKGNTSSLALEIVVNAFASNSRRC